MKSKRNNLPLNVTTPHFVAFLVFSEYFLRNNFSPFFLTELRESCQFCLIIMSISASAELQFMNFMFIKFESSSSQFLAIFLESQKSLTPKVYKLARVIIQLHSRAYVQIWCTLTPYKKGARICQLCYKLGFHIKKSFPKGDGNRFVCFSMLKFSPRSQ